MYMRNVHVHKKYMYTYMKMDKIRVTMQKNDQQ